MDKQILNNIVVFDLGNVVLFFNNRKVSKFIADKSGFPETEIHKYIFGTELERSLDRGKITLPEYLAGINNKFASRIAIEEFTPVWQDMFIRNESIERVILALKNGNCRLGMLSNTNKPHFEFVLAKFPILKLFDDYHLSYKTGYIKPETEAFEGLTRFYSCKPQDLVFIDDLQINIDAAKAYGINAFLYGTTDNLISELKGLNISI